MLGDHPDTGSSTGDLCVFNAHFCSAWGDSVMRSITAILIAPILAVTGYRFSKAWRCEDGTAKNFVYEHLLNTVKANITADKITE